MTTRRKMLGLLNRLMRKYTQGLFRDDYWEPIGKIFAEFDHAEIEYEIVKTQYMHDGHGTPNGKRWWVTVLFVNERGFRTGIEVVIITSGAGTVADPLSVYDVVAYAS